jgi:RNA polymerase sigma factor (sigma-70 family)
MKRLSPEEERQLLHECIVCGGKHKVIQQYWNLVYYTVRKTLTIKGVSFTEDDIGDLRNEVFIKLFDRGCRRLRQYREELGHGLAGWIALIANRTVLNYLRKKGFNSLSRKNTRVSIEEILDLRHKKNSLEVMEERRLIQDAMEKLPSRDRLVLKLHYYHELSLPEVASLIHTSVGATYTIKSRAIERLRAQISGNYTSEGSGFRV